MTAAELADGMEGSQAAADVVPTLRARDACGREDCVHPVECKVCGGGLLHVVVLPARALLVFMCASCKLRVGLTLPAPSTAS